MRALVDRHQADLYYSLQLLFEDRLDINLYTPVGHDWWDEGYWQFGYGTWPDDRLAQQYLSGEPGITFDGHHPERPIMMIGLAEARSIGFDYVIATVQDNQQGFKRFADEVGAKYVVQVGNTGQQVAWELDPLAIVSSEVPIRGRGVLYHQELEAETTFRRRDLPADARTIRSFVNCYPTTGPCYQRFEEAKALLPGWTFGVHGIDGPDGIINPIGAIADLMAGSGWGWHDKPHGDGFGHVIHDWAAIGRPLIGHALHYRGMLAEGLWEDMVTCIDLDRRSVEDATRLIAEITADRQRHEAMCAEIRRRFDLIDYGAEAASIKALLG